jgi:antitoxin (DNA-binding transcriptional repressor) of toxin-antitoxin stability system
MERCTVREAQDHLPRLITDARTGKTILIMDDEDQAVQLVPVPASSQPRKVGSARGLIQMTPDFDAPLADFDEYMA